MDRGLFGRGMRRGLVAAVLLLVAGATAALAGTSGKLMGRVTSKKKEPLAGANVMVIGRPLGASTDADGRYLILNVPAGTFSVKVSLIGYGTVTTQNVEVNADNSTRLDVELDESAVTMQQVVVSARRPVVELHRTSNIASVSREQLNALPVQELQDVVNLQAGVVDGHFRGGRADEVQYQVDGVTVNNPYDNKSSLRLDRSLLEEVQVISGTFDAEYGQAMSGVVNAVLKRGGDKFHWQGEVYSGGPVFGSGSGRILASTLRPASQQNYQLTLDGPTRFRSTTFLVSARHSVDDSWIRGRRVFNPWDVNVDTSGFRHLYPTGDGKDVALGWQRENSGVLKITNRALRNVELSWQALLDVVDQRDASWGFRQNPDGIAPSHTLSLVQGLDLTHTLSATRFYTVSLRQNYKNNHRWAFESVWDPRYDADLKPISYSDAYGVSYIIQGVDLGRSVQRTNGTVLKASFVDQVAKDHQFKLGFEWQTPHIQFGSPGYVQEFESRDTLTGQVTTGIQRLTAYDPKFPGVEEYRPFIGAAFAQEEVEWNDLTLRAGARFEYFDARAYLPSDLANPANSIHLPGVPLSHPSRVSSKTTVAPRLGVSYPISNTASLFFAYGHFYQMPGLGQIFESADYNQLADLQVGASSLPIMGNPDIRPEKTVQYQFGWKQAVREDIGVDVTAFYKDIRDLLGTQVVYTYTGARYARLSNADFGTVLGFTLALTARTHGAFSSRLDYTWQTANGNSSSPDETALLVASGKDANPRSLPFDWDQRHTLNLSLMLSQPDRYTLSSIVRISSGMPYTPASTTGITADLAKNSGRKPNAMIVDLRAEKRATLFGNRSSLFARVFNVFDTRFDNGFVFESSGDPYYSRFPGKDLGQLLDPTRFYGPRRIELGLSLEAGR